MMHIIKKEFTKKHQLHCERVVKNLVIQSSKVKNTLKFLKNVQKI